MTQGTIFSGALAEDYPGCLVSGIIITAKCDLLHDKVARYTYLPIVTVSDWLQVDGSLVAAERAKKDILNSLANYLRNHEYAPEILDTERPHDVVNALFPADGCQRSLRRDRPKALDLVERFDALCECASLGPGKELFAYLKRTTPRILESVIGDLFSGRLNGHYLLDTSLYDELSGHVILLREVRHIPRVVAEQISIGVDQRIFREDPTLSGVAPNVIDVTGDDLIMPVGQLISPFLEHMMQHFALLFSRIGVPDPDRTYLHALLQTNLDNGGQE